MSFSVQEISDIHNCMLANIIDFKRKYMYTVVHVLETNTGSFGDEWV